MLYFGYMQGGQPKTGRFTVFKGVKTPGFTVIEVMIVLGVTGLLFASAALLISGRQNQAGFDQAIQQIRTQIQQVINEVAVGYFPDTNFRCVAGASGPDISSVPSGGQGTNSGCIFIGKAMQFDIYNTNPEEFAVHTIAGLQQTASGQESQSLTDAKPKAVAPSTAEPTLPNLTTSNILQNGLTTAWMRYNNGGADQSIGEVAFVNSLASYDAGSGAVKSGIQQVNIVPVFGTALDTTKLAGVNAIDSTDFRDPAKSPVNPVNGVSICFVSGGTNQSGLITIGGNNRELTVNLAIKGNKTCA